MTDFTKIAEEVSTGDELVQRLFPFIAGLIPGAAVYEPLIGALLSAIDGAAKIVSQQKPGASATDILTTLINHNTPGMPNSKALS